MGEGVDVGEAAVGILGHGPADDLVDLLRDIAAGSRERGRVVARDLEHERGHLAVEGRAAGEHLVEDGAERPDVGADVDVLGLAHELRRRVAGEAEHRRRRHLAADAGGGRVAHELGGAEVDELERGAAAEALGEEEVRGLHLAQDDVVRVRLGDGLRRLEDQADGLAERHGPALLEVRREVDALEVRAREVEGAVGQRADVEDAGDVLGLELGEGARLSPEPVDLFLVAQGGREDPHHDALVELGVEGLDEEAPRAAQDSPDAVLSPNDVARSDRIGAHSFEARVLPLLHGICATILRGCHHDRIAS